MGPDPGRQRPVPVIGGNLRSSTVSSPRIGYLDARGGDEPVAFLHGVGSSSSTWRELFGRIGPPYRLIAADLRGHGRSEVAPVPYRLADFVDDHVRLLDELTLASAHVVGFSLGALIGQAIALAHPDRTSSLVLLNCIGARTKDERARAAERLRVIRASAPAEVARASVARWFTEGFAVQSPHLVAGEVGIVSATDPAGYAASYEVLATNDLIADVHAISCPVLVVTGEGDIGSTPRMARDIHACIPRSRLVVVPGMKHYLHIEGAGTVADLVTGFLRDVRGRPATEGEQSPPLTQEQKGNNRDGSDRDPQVGQPRRGGPA